MHRRSMSSRTRLGGLADIMAASAAGAVITTCTWAPMLNSTGSVLFSSSGSGEASRKTGDFSASMQVFLLLLAESAEIGKNLSCGERISVFSDDYHACRVSTEGSSPSCATRRVHQIATVVNRAS